MLFHPWPGDGKSLSPRRRAPRTRTPHPTHRRLSLEPLEARCLLAANVVLEWNQVFLDTFKADRVAPVFFSREAAIVSPRRAPSRDDHEARRLSTDDPPGSGRHGGSDGRDRARGLNARRGLHGCLHARVGHTICR